MRRLRDERGVSSVLIALLMIALIGSAGMAVDLTNLVYQRSRVQNSADTAALAIAQDCALARSAKCSSPGSAAQYYADQNSDGGVTAVTKPTSTSVKVTVARDIDMTLLRVVGISTKQVGASATAKWGGHPTEGYPALPVAVPYCMYAANLPPKTTPILLRTDLLGTVHNVVVQGGSAGRLITTLLGDLAGTTDNCTTPDGTAITMLRGPIWLSGFEGAINGILNWNSSICNMHLDDVNVTVGAAAGAVIPSNCVNKLGNQIKRGQTIMLPVYVPTNNLLQLGFEMDPVVCLPLVGCPIQSVRVPPRLGVDVLGFAPFKVTGWNFSGNSQTDPNAPSCSSINLLTHPPASVGCNGIQGYFVKTTTKDPNFQYGSDGADFGASNVRLSE